MKRILVTGAGGSAGTNFIRSLRLSPEPFYIVGVDSSQYYLKLSKADKNFLIPSCKEFNYINKLNEICLRENIEFLHCQPDPEVEVLSSKRSKLRAKTFLPDNNSVVIAHDKYWFNTKMQANKVPIPVAFLVNEVFDIEKAFNMFKGEKLWLRATYGAGSLAALPVSEVAQAKMWIEYWKTRGIGWGKFMISEYLPGKEYAFQSIWKDGELITSAARERIEYLFQNRMPSGQSSTPTIAKSVYNEDVNRVATHAIMALDEHATGVFCVDLKENKNGIPCVMEINLGRFFTTSLFFSVAGSNMPYLYVKLGYGEHIPAQPKYNAVPEDLYWIRQIDCGEVMVREGEWESH